MPTTAADIRSTLVDALQIDLVGPKPDDTEHAEEVLTQAPSKWYLTGFLAPFGAKPDDRSDDEGDVEPQELGDGATSEDSQSPEATPARKPLFPSSMGMSFLIPRQTRELLTTVHWADYKPIELERQNLEVEELGDKKKRKPGGWQRIPQAASLTVPIQAAKDSFEIEIPGGSGLTLVVNCRPVTDYRFEAGTLSVSIFLVNYRQMHSSEKDASFAFQTCLI
ncbi:MAG: hypothetical protein WCA35_14460, partial [Kovacikia sp.]